MNRLQFLQSLIGIFGISVIPAKLLEQYKKIYLLQCFLKGFQYYNGPSLIDAMHAGGMLALVRERDNEHDPNAIALHFQEQKIGFLPAAENAILCKIMDAELLELMAEFTHIEKSAATWENVHVAVYVLKKTNAPLQMQAAYTEQLITPEYLTLGNKGETVTRINRNENKDSAARNVLLQFTAGDKHNLQKHAELNVERKEAQVYIVNKKRVPEKYKHDDLFKAFHDTELQLDNYFDEQGYIVASVDRLAELDSEIKEFVKRTTKSGKDIFEVLF